MPNNFSPMGQFQNVEVLGDGKVEWKTAPAGSDYLLEMRVAGDAYPRLRIQTDGQIEWGPGNAPPDTALSRIAANRLYTADRFAICGNYLWFYGAVSAAPVIWARAIGETLDAFSLDNHGLLRWGPGDAALDCELSRRAPDILNTPDRMEVGTLGVGNSESGATPGTCVKKIEVFDAAGSSLGFLAVYGSIAMSIPARISDKIRSAIWAKISEPFSRLLR